MTTPEKEIGFVVWPQGWLHLRLSSIVVTLTAGKSVRPIFSLSIEVLGYLL